MSFLLHAIHSPFNWRILKKPILLSGFKNPYKKSSKQENSSLFQNIILQNDKMRIEKSGKISSLRRLEFMPRNLDYKRRSRIPSLVKLYSVTRVKFCKLRDEGQNCKNFLLVLSLGNLPFASYLQSARLWIEEAKYFCTCNGENSEPYLMLPYELRYPLLLCLCQDVNFATLAL